DAGALSIDADCAAGASCGLATEGASIGPAPDCANASRPRDAPAARSNAVATMVIIPTAAVFISLSILDAEKGTNRDRVRPWDRTDGRIAGTRCARSPTGSAPPVKGSRRMQIGCSSFANGGYW